MARVSKILESKFVNLNGGLNNFNDAIMLPANKLQSCKNVFIEGDSIYRRPGKTKYGVAFTDAITGMYEYIDKSGNKRLLVASGTGLYENNGTTNTKLDTIVAEEINFHTLRGKCFYNGATTQRRLDGTTPGPVGLDKPATSPTAAAGTAGALTGSYAVKVTFVIESAGAVLYESDPCAVSNSITLASEILSLTDVPVSSDTRVTHRYIYRTTAGGARYWYDGKIADNTTTTYTTEVLDAALGAEVETNHGLPPTCAISASANERQFWADGSVLRCSETAVTDAYVEYHNSLSIFQMEGTIVGLGSLYNLNSGREDLYIFLADSTYILPSGDPNQPILKASAIFGTYNHKTICEYNGWLVFFSNKNSVVKCNGSQFIDISTLEIKDSIEAIVGKSSCTAGIVFNHYYALTNRNSAGKLYNTQVFLCDMRTITDNQPGSSNAVWFSWLLNCQYILQRSNGTVVYADTNDKQIYTLSLSTKQDQNLDGTLTNWETRFRTKNFDGGTLFSLKRPLKLSVKGRFASDFTIIPYYFSDRRGADAQTVSGRELFIMGTSVMGDNISQLPTTTEVVIPSEVVGNTFSFEIVSTAQDFYFQFVGLQYTYKIFKGSV